ncbi:hypothetical protein [Aeromonas molluscorum]|uniref:Uncharacterized protein n=1 Tax=Aeromonas molluscorum 848 TaxID=1268236 RepID=R1F3E8_9GAMM|nr:hypothetical protein [Aeromonas molluscorum]EOD54372.1 hypothetical protein G113_14696 [Aeromonas molluscorum 848]
MSATFNPYESALLAVLFELPVDELDDLIKRVESGFLGNAIYVNVGPEFKSSVVDALRLSAEESRRLRAL